MANITLNKDLTAGPFTLSFGGGAATYTFSMAASVSGAAVATGGTATVTNLGGLTDFGSGATIDATGEIYNFAAFPTATPIPFSAGDDFIGLSFTLSDGLHYGYAEVNGPTLVSEGYNTTPSATSTTGETSASNQPGVVFYTDTKSGEAGQEQAQAYTGPVRYLQSQMIWSRTDSVALASSTPNVFLHGGAGDDALSVSGGQNVLDGGGGSNFLVGGTGADGGTDTFFVDGRGGSVTWSTINNFHHGDSMTLWGFVSGTSTQPGFVTDGATGYQGATLHSELGGAGTGVNESVTFAGINPADVPAKFTITTGSVGGSSYLSVVYTG